MAHSKSLIVAAIDFGTTYSGWAFSFKHEFDSDPVKVSSKVWSGGQLVSLKAPTCVLIHDDGETVHSFGYEAETKYSEIAENEDPKQWYFFRSFKMMLFGKIGVKKNILLEDLSGRKLSALKVFSLVIRYLTDDLNTEAGKRLGDSGFTRDEVHWVLTVPAIWNDAAKQFMREAAELATIKSENLTIALEPEAASLYCRHLPVGRNKGDTNVSLAKFKTGSKYLVLDAGGGTVDITVHEITSSGTIRELHQASGGAWGGTKVDEAYEKFLIGLVGPATMKAFKKVHIEDYIDLFRDFEIKKRSVTPQKEGNTTCKIPIALVEMYKDVTQKVLKDTISSSKHANQVSVTGDKLRVDAEVMKGLFSGPVKSIVNHVRELLRNPSVTGCSAIVLVGGFSESPILQDEIRRSFPEKKIIVPDEPGLAVLKGAVIFGHTPRAIAERVCKYTYGTEIAHKFTDECDHPNTRREKDSKGVLLCHDIFDTHVQIGQTVKLGEEQPEQMYTPIYDDQTLISFPLYASSTPNPYQTTQKGCHKIGECTIPIGKYDGSEREVGVRLVFGGTEIEVIIEDKTTGKVTRKHVDFLG